MGLALAFQKVSEAFQGAQGVLGSFKEDSEALMKLQRFHRGFRRVKVVSGISGSCCEPLKVFEDFQIVSGSFFFEIFSGGSVGFQVSEAFPECVSGVLGDYRGTSGVPGDFRGL